MLDGGTDNDRAESQAGGTPGGFSKRPVELDASVHPGFAGVSPSMAGTLSPSLCHPWPSCHWAWRRLPSSGIEGGGAGTQGGAAATRHLPLSRQPAARGPAAPTWSLLRACFLSRLLNLTGLEVIALILLILIAHTRKYLYLVSPRAKIQSHHRACTSGQRQGSQAQVPCCLGAGRCGAKRLGTPNQRNGGSKLHTFLLCGSHSQRPVPLGKEGEGRGAGVFGGGRWVSPEEFPKCSGGRWWVWSPFPRTSFSPAPSPFTGRSQRSPIPPSKVKDTNPGQRLDGDAGLGGPRYALT